MVLISLYLFRSLAIAVYVLMGLFTSNYILSIVIVASYAESFATAVLEKPRM